MTLGGLAAINLHQALATCEAEWSRVVGEPDPERWRSAVEAWDKAGQPYPAAHGRWRLAEALLAGGTDREQAERAARDAHATAVRLGARPLRTELELLARRGRPGRAGGRLFGRAARRRRPGRGGRGRPPPGPVRAPRRPRPPALGLLTAMRPSTNSTPIVCNGA
jgi:hypothetical protein